MIRQAYGGKDARNLAREKEAGADVLFSLAEGEARIAAERFQAERRTLFARQLCTSVLREYWRHAAGSMQCPWHIREPVVQPENGLEDMTGRMGRALQALPNPRAGFLVGQLYTTLLPGSVRKELGAFYTPPPLVARLLDAVTDAGFDWQRGSVIDPACGGAAFLAAVAPRLADASRGRTANAILDDVETRLAGIEVDPFSAWMAMVLLDVSLLRLCMKAKRRVRDLIMTRDALDPSVSELGRFDLVLGNPPYGKVKLSPTLRSRFRRSLFGHANLYGLFTELGVNMVRESGLLAYVTPTSFLGGEYFKRLRAFLCEQAPLVRADFVEHRAGVFDGVLQETMLAVFRRRGTSAVPAVRVHTLQTRGDSRDVSSIRIGEMPLPGTCGGPWILPRTLEQAELVRQLARMPHRLTDYGFSVATGPLVWNRHKDQLCATPGPKCVPIIWAESVGAAGTFQFQAVRRNHLPYLKMKQGQSFLVTQEPCVLVQRTTAKEQTRRLIAAVIPNSFVVEYPGFSVENHLNMVLSMRARPTVALATLASVLNSAVVDRAFRCINGSVAVSAYELNSLPLPAPSQMKRIQDAVVAGAAADEVEAMIAACYAPRHESHELLTTRHPPPHHNEMVA